MSQSSPLDVKPHFICWNKLIPIEVCLSSKVLYFTQHIGADLDPPLWSWFKSGSTHKEFFSEIPWRLCQNVPVHIRNTSPRDYTVAVRTKARWLICEYSVVYGWPTLTVVSVCVCPCVFTSLHECVKLWGFDRMSLSDCLYACMHTQHCVLPTAVPLQFPYPSFPVVEGGESLITCDMGFHDSLGPPMSPPLHTEVLLLRTVWRLC